ncbi:shufflon system plasmid conjugative transfer pilus tip adhesin PilV [Pectobacterium sp. B2J-2]|uniref:shufflon system plasmid conjugative transfer pilus tip adhesin PilV n=1 Tax=Pectobacterium sp. B2J-2 TaxID=3385372 RepID=UPI0038FC682D
MTTKRLSLQKDGQLWASGNITSDKTVSGQYLQPTSTAVAGATCTSNGLISKDTTGKTLSCVSGKWAAGSGMDEIAKSLSYVDQNNSHNYCPDGTAIFAYYGTVGYKGSYRSGRNYYNGWVTPAQLSLIDSESWGDSGGGEWQVYTISNVSKIKCG